MYTSLSKSYRRFFPFKIATTSYIYPDHIIPNVEMLAPYLDEIELVLFESGEEDNLPSTDDIKHLVAITREQGLSYNVHLPIDIYLGDPNPAVRDHGVAVVHKIIALTGPLEPSTYTLHLSLRDQYGQDDPNPDEWEKRLYPTINEMLKTGITSTMISIETLDYPFDLIEDIIEAFDFSVCLDLGHLILHGRSMADYAKRYLQRTTVIHLHGVKDGTDHLSLDVLGKHDVEAIRGILSHFTGTVSIEVFSFRDLTNSLTVLEKWYTRQ